MTPTKLMLAILGVAVCAGLSACSPKVAQPKQWTTLEEAQVSKFLPAEAGQQNLSADELMTRALQIEAFIAEQSPPDASVSALPEGLQSDLERLRGYQKDYLTEASKLAADNADISHLLLTRFRESSGPLEVARRRMASQAAQLSSAPAPNLKDAAANLPLARKALALSGQIREFESIWSTLAVEGVRTDIENAVAPHIRFLHPADLPLGKPYEALSASDLTKLMPQLEAFIRYCPGTIAIDAEKVETFQPGRTWAYLAAGTTPAGNKTVLDRLQTAGSAADRLLSGAIVQDMLVAYGDIEPAVTFRKEVVREFSNATGLTNPNPAALVVAILGSVVLFGGLAHAIYLAASGGRRRSGRPD